MHASSRDAQLPTEVGLISGDMELVQECAEALSHAGFGVTPIDPDDVSRVSRPPTLLVLDHRRAEESWEKRLRALRANFGTLPPTLILVPDRHEPPHGGVEFQTSLDFERLPVAWDWVAARLRRLQTTGITPGGPELEQLRRVGWFDALTGLATRHHFIEELGNLCSDDRHVALLLIDVDAFKRVNDRYGPWNGDLLLQEIGNRLRAAVRSSPEIPAITTDTNRPVLGRLNGDEFTIAVPDIELPAAQRVADEVAHCFDTPFEVDGVELRVRASVGIASSPIHGTTPQELVHSADLAMQGARRCRDGQPFVYKGEVGEAAERRALIEEGLPRALEAGEFQLCYQPRLHLRSMRIRGAEALIRWTHAELGPISPGEFIPIAEETDQIFDLGGWVLERVCGDIAEGILGADNLTVSLNVSSRQFERPNLAREFLDAIEASGVDPARIEFEVTESVALRRVEEATRILEELQAAGCHVALDDFGTGYSSLQTLLELPLDTLKLDRSVVGGMAADEDKLSVVRAMVLMAHSVGLRVVAEGVSEDVLIPLLGQLGCDEAQGFAIAHPMPAKKLADRLRRQAL
ncbi:MAG: bifunctional diguanylate cyclase/phosphodiesterase [Myxococcota bacterium]